MISTASKQRHRRRRRPAATDAHATTPASARFGSPWEQSWPRPAEPAPAARVDLSAARRHLESAWHPDADRWDLLRGLVADFGCTRHQAEVLLAERDAVQRARDAGLDPAPVRAQAEKLLAGPAGD